MTKVFTVNKNGKIELTKDELQKLLDDSYWEGYRANSGTYVYTSPSRWWNPWSITYCSNTVGTTAKADNSYCASSVTDGNHYDGVTLTADAVNCGNAIKEDYIEITLNNIDDAIKAGELK